MNKKILLTVGTVLSVLCIIGMLITFIGAPGTGVPQEVCLNVTIIEIVGILALVSLIIYFVTGATKEKGMFYNAFLFLFATSHFLAVILNNGLQTKLTALAGMVLFANTLLLLVSKDLGKTKSLIIVICSIVAALLLSIGLIMSGYLLGAILDGGWHILSTVVMLFAILSKYADKAERGRPMN